MRQSRLLILEAARDEFATRGFAGARTQRIAQRAGVNKQLLFYYFGSKRGLYDAVLDEAKGALARPIEAAHTAAQGAQGIRARLAEILRAATCTPEIGRLVAAGAQLPDGHGSARTALQGLIRELSATISDGQGIGYFRDDAEPDVAARQAAVLVLGYLALEPALESAGDAASREAWVDDVIRLVTRGLTW